MVGDSSAKVGVEETVGMTETPGPRRLRAPSCVEDFTPLERQTLTKSRKAQKFLGVSTKQVTQNSLKPTTEAEWYREKPRGVLHPNTSPFIKKWDVVVGVTLIFTALVTPYEVAFLSVKMNVLFWINRVVDLVFLMDIVLNFRLAFFSDAHRKWIVDKQIIRWHYLTTWFGLDIVSTFPFDVLDFVVGAAQSDTSNDREGMEHLKVLRVLKILKLFKLIRLLKSARIFKAAIRYFGLTNSTATLVKYLVGFLACIHWLGCLWGLGPSLQGEEANSWVVEHKHQDNGPFGMYLLGLYFSVQCMVMGETESTMPVTNFERLLSIVCFMIGGAVYAYVIGSVCSIISERDPATKMYYEMCDAVTQFSYEHNLPDEMSSRLYEYFVNCQHLFRSRLYNDVRNEMAPALQKEIAGWLHGGWLQKISFFQVPDPDERKDFIAGVSALLEPFAYPPKDCMCVIGHNAKYMCIITRGIATVAGSAFQTLFKEGDHFGEEFIMMKAVYAQTVRTLTYVHAHHLEHDHLFNFLGEHPNQFKRTSLYVRGTGARMALKAFVLVAYKLHRAKLGLKLLTPEERADYKAKVIQLGKQKHSEKLQRKLSTGKSPAKNVGSTSKHKGRYIAEVTKEMRRYTTPELASWLLDKYQLGNANQEESSNEENSSLKEMKTHVQSIDRRTTKIEETVESVALMLRRLLDERNQQPNQRTLVAEDREEAKHAEFTPSVRPVAKQRIQLAPLDQKAPQKSSDTKLQHKDRQVEEAIHKEQKIPKETDDKATHEVDEQLKKEAHTGAGTSTIKEPVQESIVHEGQPEKGGGAELSAVIVQGAGPGQLHHDCMGKYTLQETGLDGRATYRRDGDKDAVLYYTTKASDGIGRWFIFDTPASKAKTPTGWLCVSDQAMSPERATTPWHVGDGTAWIEANHIRAVPPTSA